LFAALLVVSLPIGISYPDIAGDCNGPGGPHNPRSADSSNLKYKVRKAQERVYHCIALFPPSRRSCI
jgi:hypothetical protein